MDMDKPLNVGFIGLGAMGLPMAANLATKLPTGSRLFVFDVSKAAMEAFTKSHPTSSEMCDSTRTVAAKATIIFTMVPEGSHVRSVYLDESNGLLTGNVQSGQLLVDCSTIDCETSSTVHEAVKTRGGTGSSFYDAPVSGGTLGAEKATLTFMLGCSEKDANYALLHALISLMGKTIVACGGPGLGLVAKLSNNYCSALIALATAEAMNMGMRSGMDPRLLARVFASSTAQSTICDKWNPVPGICPEAPSSHGYRGGFKVQLMRKDFGLAVEAARRVGAKLLLGDAGLAGYTDASEDPRCRDLDSRVVFRYLGGDEGWEETLHV
ncbi:NAD binding domain of 6-phosphogluconate dehydrogenase-domain-containing protein [Apodospora peruviana]|uniref:3-hydroxyisobutyrate dehydrogenase n=1 Tax=Apodospora peruviana TaxID=516989 RepID=A0AAE0HUA1_9PEZI|nr:NAD binding domain of 6-phosphogluconate dehydrogenase-domain-containing protein [Apodospora peruviana]